METDYHNMNDGKGDMETAYTKEEKNKKDRSGESDESGSDISDSDSEVSDHDEDEESDDSDDLLANISVDDDIDSEEQFSSNTNSEREMPEALRKYYRTLSAGRLMHINRERLVLDPGAGFYIIDGDSLMLEAIGTKSWNAGQQLHLFYIIETFLYQLKEGNGGTFEIVFFKDMEKIWYHDLILRVFRESLINHLLVNCEIKVNCNWMNPFSAEWLEYLNSENPSFIFIHDGHHTSPSTNTALKILTYNCLACNVNVAFTGGVEQQASKLHAIFVKSFSFPSLRDNKSFLLQAWTCLLEFLDTKFYCVSLSNKHSVDGNLKDKIFLESISCYWYDLSEQERGSSEVTRILNRWCRYFALLSVASLSERAGIARHSNFISYRKNLVPGNELFTFISCILQSIYGVTNSLSTFKDPESIADLIDLAVYLQLFKDDPPSPLLTSDEIERKYLNLRELASSLRIEFESDSISLPHSPKLVGDTVSVGEGSKLIAVESDLANEYAGEIRRSLNIAENGVLDMSDSDDGFDDIYDWKTGDPLKDDIDLKASKALSKTPVIRRKQLREVQKFNAFLTTYGKSLESSIEPTTITKSESKDSKKAEKVPQKQKSKKQSNKKNMRETIIEENKKKITDESKKKIAIQWKTKKGELDEITDLGSAMRKVTEFIRKSESAKLCYEEPNNFLLQLQYDRWKQSCAEKEGTISYAADLVHTMHGILQSQHPVSDNIKLKIAKYFKRLGFESVVSQVMQSLTEGKSNPLKVADKCPVGMNYNVFQMKYMGHLLKRQERSDPDPRVAGFIPDTWQRDLLDVVDKNESAVIVAPTSSGKTFCSFYCMEKVLRESDTNIVVYVSPTKALVNQVQASIYARYKKNMPAGMSVVGVFTRDYQHNALTSQILVTVPQCLEILLLSPKRQQWASRLSYVIFDEVHCIGAESGGEVWEHLITLIRCPFLALSATIGNPDFFHSWLRCVNKFKEMQSSDSGAKGGKGSANMKYSVKLVVYNERYSDISKNIYLPQNDEIVETHPCTFLDAYYLSSNGFPSAFNLSPKEAYELWESGIFTFQGGTELNILKKWSPECYFNDELFITKLQAREYEISLKQQLVHMLKGKLTEAQNFITYFRNKLPDNCVTNNSLKGFHIRGISESDFDIYKQFPLLIERLKKEDKLPVIVFMNNRLGIEKLARSLLRHVAYKIKDVRLKSGTSVQSDANKAKKTGKARKGGRDSDGERVEDHVQEYLHTEMSKLNLQIQKKENACKFIAQGTISIEDRVKVIGQLKDKLMLEYGIAYHHAGCNANHKKAVEILFRSQYSQVVMATSTLAMGIHMPCKSVVFVGDDHYVDSLMYRQMSGRSGRRGFDNLGNVIFYGVPAPKISKLVKADISTLDGQFPVNCTIVLRLLLLVAKCQDFQDAHKKALTVLSHPFITHQNPSLQNQLRYYFLFVTDFLIRQALIDEKGVPLGFSGLVSHIHFQEPGNLVFVSLLKKGLFHDLCKPSVSSQPINFGSTCSKCNTSPIVGNIFTCTKCPYDNSMCAKCHGSTARHRFRKDEHFANDFLEQEANLKFTYPEDTLRSLVCILAHIFCVKDIPHIRLKRSDDDTYILRQKPKFSSKVLLDPLPENIKQAITAYNEDVRSIFSNYLSVVSGTIPKDGSATLPISKKSWKLSSKEIQREIVEDATAVDPFVRLSGISNMDVKSYCLDTEEIRRILPRQIYMDFNFIPALSTGRPKNAFALDFFKHMSKKAILLDNWIQLGEMYDSLNDFRLLIGTISTALEQLGPEKEDDHVVWAFKHLQFEYTHRFKLVYPKSRH